ncbi:MAG: autotransporter outer membrane beta-barrel domain-containing protein [Geminicoccaceae bacterium]
MSTLAAFQAGAQSCGGSSLPPILQSVQGVPGANGASAGAPGSPGGSAATLAATVDDCSINAELNPAIGLTGTGGAGGDGASTKLGFGVAERGGAGGTGGAGSAITLNATGSFQAGIYGLQVKSIGGTGGNGGLGKAIITNTYGGGGAVGGTGGDIGVTVSGTVRTLGTGVYVLSQGGAGGSGGEAATLGRAEAGPGGAGGGAGTVNVTSAADIGAPFLNAAMLQGIRAHSLGGNGGKGGLGGAGGAFGGDGGIGGTGGSVTVTVASGTVAGNVGALAYGGDGGGGGESDGIASDAGDGGTGGTGGSAWVTIGSGATVEGSQGDPPVEVPAAVLVQANGGYGGAGGALGFGIGKPGGGGFGGAGGTVAAEIDGAVSTSLANAPGLLAQSVGGVGGDGGSAFGLFFAEGGVGLTGGDGGAVTVGGNGGNIVTSGQGAPAIIAQSVGGGGGSGGDALAVAISDAGVAIGGNGGLGGDGGPVTIDIDDVLTSTSTQGGGGILAHSIGGAGGSGGNATAAGFSVFTFTVGGDAAGGGVGGNVDVTNAGLITTFGDHADGIAAQSIGGGGGKGGAAISVNANAVLSAAVAIGGRGGSGGAAGTVSVTNQDQIVTYGPDSPGVKAQSIGGGGGTGGTAKATAIAIGPPSDPPLPSIATAVSIGGAGGAGNTGNTASVGNEGFIATSGHGSPGIFAQSVGGGGGNGGDSTASAVAVGEGTNLSVSVAIGGSGGAGATGGAADVTNSGLIYTLGESAYGALAQSVGGGGGFGGGGDSSSSAASGEESLAASISVGGTGGFGGNGGAVQIANDAGIATSGDGADGMFGQSVGGGGGTAGGGVGKANGGDVAIGVGVGGKGGAGGNGGQVQLQNTGGIATIGTDAAGMTAQSVGGGGGRGGKGGATAGGAPQNTAGTLANAIGNGLGIGQSTQSFGNGAVKVGDGQLGGVNSVAQLGQILGPEGEGGDDGEGGVRLAVGVGGSGGAAGNGGLVTVTNSGEIGTSGALSDGIFAHSVGGGGGKGGASSGTARASGTAATAEVIVGGSGGAAGGGGNVTVTNEADASIETAGVSAHGIVAQSVGGGGGSGTVSGSTSGALNPQGLFVPVAIGGSGGAAGTGGAVTVTNQGGTITTTGKHAIGILAQSVGGGGGLVHVISTDQTGNQSDNPTNDGADDFNLALTFIGGGGQSGDGGDVMVTTAGNDDAPGSGDIFTGGRDAHGIVAQSVGGGGGAVVGGVVLDAGFVEDTPASASGSGGTVTVTVADTTVSTTGDGAIGVWAQSVGGGGIIAGDTAGAATPLAFTALPGVTFSGDGGSVTVSVSGGTVATSGDAAPAIFAQSVGGGGGQVTTSAGTYTGSLSGEGSGGPVAVTLASGASVVALGVGSAGIHAQSAGQQQGSIAISVDASSLLLGGTGSGQEPDAEDAPGIFLDGGDANTVDNAGTIGSQGGVDGTAILANTPAGNTTVTNTGTITGSIIFAGPGNTVNNLPGGTLDAGSRITLGNGGRLTNAGRLGIGGTGNVAVTKLDGDYVQASRGRLQVDLDTARGRADHLEVTGRAEVAGTVAVSPLSLDRTPVKVLSAEEGVVVDPDFAAEPTYLFGYRPVVDGTSVGLTAEGGFRASDGSLNDRQGGVAGHLQEVWDGEGAALAEGFASLASIGDAQTYRDTLDNLSGQPVTAISSMRYDASQSFARGNLSCPTFDGDRTLLAEHDCSWGRIVGTTTDRNGTGTQIGYDWQSVTAMVGGQAEVQPGWFLGGSLGYEASRMDGNDDSADVDGQGALGAVSLHRQSGPLLLAGVIDFGYGWYDTNRTIEIGGTKEKAKASPDSLATGVHARAAWQMPFETWYLQPRLDLDATYVWMDGYKEHGGSDFDLDVESEDKLIFSATPAVEIGARLALKDGSTMRAYASAGLSLLSANNWNAESRFVDAPAGSDGFDSQLDNPNLIGRFTAGVDVVTTGSVSIRFQYDAGVADGYLSNSGLLRVSLAL